jgi:hypothetical protein
MVEAVDADRSGADRQHSRRVLASGQATSAGPDDPKNPGVVARCIDIGKDAEVRRRLTCCERGGYCEFWLEFLKETNMQFFFTIIKRIFVGSAMFAVANAGALAQANRDPRIRAEQSSGDTLKMTCSEAISMVRGKNGVILNTGGPDFFNRYHRRDASCDRAGYVTQPAFVRTKDSPSCMIGFTCELPED